jgi:hypothetical protein
MKLVLYQNKTLVTPYLFAAREDAEHWLRRAMLDQGLTLTHIDFSYDVKSGDQPMAIFCQTEMGMRRALEGFRLVTFREYYGGYTPTVYNFNPITTSKHGKKQSA